jgi:anti-sigma regulatory factor (Ser/Thr protein kinase)
MQSSEATSTRRRQASRAEPVDPRSELHRLRATCRRQARAVELLSAALSTLRGGSAALKAENAELRAVNERLGRQVDAGGRPGGEASAGGALEVRLPLDAQAPGAARLVVGGVRDRVPLSVLADAQLMVSELVTNSVRHSGAPAGGVVVVRVQVTAAMLRLEVEDPGRGGAIAPRMPDFRGGFGLNLVQALSERWGLERAAAGGTRIWAQLELAPGGGVRVAAGGRSSST